MKIFLAAAHGGTDPGAVANGTTEREEVIKIVNTAAALLAPVLKPDQKLIIVPHEFGLIEEVSFINNNTAAPLADICIEVNMNANAGTPGTGIEAYWGYKKLAETLYKKIVEVTKLPGRFCREDNTFYFNKMTAAGSVLLEIGFINNSEDLKVVRERGGLSLARALASFLGVNLPEQPTPTPPTIDYKKLYEELAVKFVKLTLAIKKLYEENPVLTL